MTYRAAGGEGAWDGKEDNFLRGEFGGRGEFLRDATGGWRGVLGSVGNVPSGRVSGWEGKRTWDMVPL